MAGCERLVDSSCFSKSSPETTGITLETSHYRGGRRHIKDESYSLWTWYEVGDKTFVNIFF